MRRYTIKVVAVAMMLSSAQGAVHTWTGGVSRVWTEPRNWAGGDMTPPVKSAEFVFDSAAGATFQFAEPFVAAGVATTTNAGSFAIRAPSIRLGANVADDKHDGWVLEDVVLPASVVNKSAKPLGFTGAASLASDAVFDAADAPITFSAGMEGGRALVKRGPADVMISGGKAVFKTVSIEEGRLVLNDTDVFVASAGTFSAKKYGTDLVLSGGARLTTPLVANTTKTMEMNPRFTMTGKSAADGRPSLWDAGGSGVNFISHGASLQNGAVVTNVAVCNVYMPAGVTNAIGYALSGGAKLYCKAFNFATAHSWNHKTASNMVFTVRGVPGAKPADQTVLDVGGGQLHAGARQDGNAASSHNSMFVTDGARIDNASWICITHNLGGVGNLMRIDKGAQVSCVGIIIGATGRSNVMEIAGAGTRVGAGGGELRIASMPELRWGAQNHNGLRLSDGAVLENAGAVYVGRSRSNVENDRDRGNFLHVSGGAKLQTRGATVSHAGPKSGSTNNWARVEGRGTRWDVGGGLTVGYGESGPSFTNRIMILDGAAVTNATKVSVGYTVGARAAGNRMQVANGARVWTHDIVRVGETNTRYTYCPADENIVTVAGGAMGESVWDMGGAALYIGSVAQVDSPARDNKFVLLPGGRVVNAGLVHIGRGKGTAAGNALVLAGGQINAQSLNIGKGNGIDVALTAAGVKPVLVEGDVTIAEGVYVNPLAAPGVTAGRHVILAWKGAAKDIANLKLHEQADTRKWSIEIDEAGKKVFLGVR